MSTLGDILRGALTPRVNPTYPTAYQGGQQPATNIPDHSITYPKIQEVSANVVLGQGNTTGTVIEIPFTPAARTFSAAGDQAAQRSVLGIPPGTIVSTVNLTSTSLTVAGSPLPSANNTITVNLPSIANLTVLGVGSGGNTTAKPIILVAGSGVTLTPAAGNITISATGGGGGNVSGPGSSGNGTAALFNGTTGQLIEDSKVFITIPAGNATLTIDNGFTLHATANATVSGTNTGDQSAANPTATASDTAVNGSASTFMRSDAAPAVQKTSASVFGLCKVDGTTITAAAGVISAPGGGGAGSLYPAFTAPVDSNYAWVNQGGASTTVNGNGGVYLNGPKSTGPNLRVRKLALPGTPAGNVTWTLTTAFFPFCVSVNDQLAGICTRESSSGKIISFHAHGAANTPIHRVEIIRWTSATAFSAISLNLSSYTDAALTWFQIKNDGTNLIYSYSMDGYNFIQVFSEAKGSFYTGTGYPNEAGFFVEEESNTYDIGNTLMSWNVTSP